MKKRILVAPLNWGLGHATRCIPIIDALINANIEPIIASDGMALLLLKKEFSQLKHLDLPSYNIEYPKEGESFKWKLIKQFPRIIKTIEKEQYVIKNWVEEHQINGIISDNRFGIYSHKVPSVYITHQLNVLSGNTTVLTSKMHQNLIRKYDQCWIPDYEGSINLSDLLGHVKNNKGLNLNYMGPISRFKKQSLNSLFDIMILLSGPEPQRTLLENKLLTEFANYNGNVLLVRGLVEDSQTISNKKHFTIYNFMQSQELERAINESKIVIARSGYTTIMDLCKLEKKALFIPTPGQFEQEYLARHLQNSNIAPFCLQNEFTIERLKDVENFKGFRKFNDSVDYKTLFSLFKSK